MKQYFITSLYSQGTQVSIQQDHASKELMKNVLKNQESKEFQIFDDYINNHKTTVSLGVGQPTEILKLYSYMMVHKDALGIPMGIFQEESMNNTATCLTFVATEKLSNNIHFSVLTMLKTLQINDLYSVDILNDEIFPYHYVDSFSKVEIVIHKEKDVFSFHVSYKEQERENTDENMHFDLDDQKTIKELYKKYNPNDYNFFNSDNVDEKIKMVDKEFVYSIEELNFLLMTKSLRLK